MAAPLDRLTIQEAARLLGISEGAVRNRIKAGMYEAEKVITEPRYESPH